VVSDPYRIGRDPSCHLVVDESRVAPQHARVRYVKGEHVLSGEGGAPVQVNGHPAPMMPLRTGDLVTLTPADDPRPLCLRFVSRIQGTFVPPGTSIGTAWLGHPGRQERAEGPDRFGPGEPLGGRDASRCRRAVEPETGAAVVVKRLGPVRTGPEADRWLLALEALAGAPHPDVAPVVDGGIVAEEPSGPALRWIACRHEEGRALRDLLAEGPLPFRAAVRALRSLARAVAHLHRRGVVHRDVSPGNVIVRPGGGAALVDLGHTVLAGAATSGRGVVGTPGFVAPEEVLGGTTAVDPAADVYGLGAVGYAMLTGAAPATGTDVLETLAAAGSAPLPPRALGVSLPEAFEAALLAALDRDPARRPDAEAFERAVVFAEALTSLTGGSLVAGSG
jgi:serine/threonine-protein kinase